MRWYQSQGRSKESPLDGKSRTQLPERKQSLHWIDSRLLLRASFDLRPLPSYHPFRWPFTAMEDEAVITGMIHPADDSTLLYSQVASMGAASLGHSGKTGVNSRINNRRPARWRAPLLSNHIFRRGDFAGLTHLLFSSEPYLPSSTPRSSHCYPCSGRL